MLVLKLVIDDHHSCFAKGYNVDTACMILHCLTDALPHLLTASDLDVHTGLAGLHHTALEITTSLHP